MVDDANLVGMMLYTSEATDRETIERLKRDYQSLMQFVQQLVYVLVFLY